MSILAICLSYTYTNADLFIFTLQAPLFRFSTKACRWVLSSAAMNIPAWRIWIHERCLEIFTHTCSHPVLNPGACVRVCVRVCMYMYACMYVCVFVSIYVLHVFVHVSVCMRLEDEAVICVCWWHLQRWGDVTNPKYYFYFSLMTWFYACIRVPWCRHNHPCRDVSITCFVTRVASQVCE